MSACCSFVNRLGIFTMTAVQYIIATVSQRVYKYKQELSEVMAIPDGSIGT
jgi:hypothetical protein